MVRGPGFLARSEIYAKVRQKSSYAGIDWTLVPSRRCDTTRLKAAAGVGVDSTAQGHLAGAHAMKDAAGPQRLSPLWGGLPTPSLHAIVPNVPMIRLLVMTSRDPGRSVWPEIVE